MILFVRNEEMGFGWQDFKGFVFGAGLIGFFLRNKIQTKETEK